MAGRLKEILMTSIIIWGALAEIAPKLFGLDADRQTATDTVFGIIFHPVVTWIAAAAVIIWLVWHAAKLKSGIDALVARPIPDLKREIDRILAKLREFEEPPPPVPSREDAKTRVQKWMSSQQLAVRDLSESNPTASFYFVAHGPAGIAVHQPHNRPAEIHFLAHVDVSPEHVRAIKALPEKKRKAFLRRIRLWLLTYGAQAQFREVSGRMEFRITDILPDTPGLNAAAFLSRFHWVSNAVLLIIELVQSVEDDESQSDIAPTKNDLSPS